MPARRLMMRKICEVLRLKHQRGLSRSSRPWTANNLRSVMMRKIAVATRTVQRLDERRPETSPMKRNESCGKAIQEMKTDPPRPAEVALRRVIESRSKLGTECVTEIMTVL